MNTIDLETEPIEGWGADADPSSRPGVPEEFEPPHPIGNPDYVEPEQQRTGEPTVKAATRPLTPVYATSIPARGLSGLVRRLAYRIPEYKPRRWMLLLLADRIDVVEHNPIPILLGAGAIALAVTGAIKLRRR